MGLGMPLFLLRSRRNRCAPSRYIYPPLYRDRLGFCQRSIIRPLMDLRTEGLDKLLESLGPALSADVGRILESTRRQLEEEFRKRLEAVIRDTEKAAASLTDSQREEILAKAREQLSLELKD